MTACDLSWKKPAEEILDSLAIQAHDTSVLSIEVFMTNSSRFWPR